jgi:hypothetical protein
MTRPPVPKPAPRPKRERAYNSTLPKPSGFIDRMKALLPFNRKRKERRQEAGRVYGPYFHWVRENASCLIFGAPGHVCYHGIDPHHIQSVGAGGEDERNLAPLCRGAHQLAHQLGRETFELRYAVDLQAAADRLWAEYIGEGW